MVAEVRKKEEERKKELCLSNRQRMELFKKVILIILHRHTHTKTPNKILTDLQSDIIQHRTSGLFIP